MRHARAIHGIATGLTLAAAVVLAGGCEAGPPELDTRTYRIEHIPGEQAAQLLRPYIYADREEAPGRTSMAQGAVTIRETPDNLAKIERVLSQYDVPSPYVRLRFQLIRANGSDGTDPAIAEVESQLRDLFQFDGYELVGETVVTARDRTHTLQEFPGTDSEYAVEADIGFQPPETVRLTQVRLRTLEGGRFETSVNLRPGQTVILGSSRGGGSGGALILTVRAEVLGPEG